ncbi:hypothetical protein DFJ73DRAFT_802836 [Zopfochytrium polystomum]|nr:hypothetical protein DFJ73DRAFT_802836 [Zopfochytrium polystomum]
MALVAGRAIRAGKGAEGLHTRRAGAEEERKAGAVDFDLAWSTNSIVRFDYSKVLGVSCKNLMGLPQPVAIFTAGSFDNFDSLKFGWSSMSPTRHAAVLLTETINDFVNSMADGFSLASMPWVARTIGNILTTETVYPVYLCLFIKSQLSFRPPIKEGLRDARIADTSMVDCLDDCLLLIWSALGVLPAAILKEVTATVHKTALSEWENMVTQTCSNLRYVVTALSGSNVLDEASRELQKRLDAAAAASPSSLREHLEAVQFAALRESDGQSDPSFQSKPGTMRRAVHEKRAAELEAEKKMQSAEFAAAREREQAEAEAKRALIYLKRYTGGKVRIGSTA